MKNTTSKKKRRKKKYRLGAAKEWMKNYEGEDIVKGYARWFGVDLICAIKELRMNGLQVDEAYEKEVKEKIEAKKHWRKLNRQHKNKYRKMSFWIADLPILLDIHQVVRHMELLMKSLIKTQNTN